MYAPSRYQIVQCKVLFYYTCNPILLPLSHYTTELISSLSNNKNALHTIVYITFLSKGPVVSIGTEIAAHAPSKVDIPSTHLYLNCDTRVRFNLELLFQVWIQKVQIQQVGWVEIYSMQVIVDERDDYAIAQGINTNGSHSKKKKKNTNGTNSTSQSVL